MLIARGRAQQYYWGLMTGANGCPSMRKLVIGRARRYLDLYEQGFRRMIDRAKREGWEVERVPGPRGGEWGAIYKATPTREHAK